MASMSAHDDLERRPAVSEADTRLAHAILAVQDELRLRFPHHCFRSLWGDPIITVQVLEEDTHEVVHEELVWTR
jgi:hypothetical protein